MPGWKMAKGKEALDHPGWAFGGTVARGLWVWFWACGLSVGSLYVLLVSTGFSMFSNFFSQSKNMSVAVGVCFYVSVNGCESLYVLHKVSSYLHPMTAGRSSSRPPTPWVQEEGRSNICNTSLISLELLGHHGTTWPTQPDWNDGDTHW